MSLTEKNTNQMILNIEPEDAKNRKMRVYQILVQLKRTEGNEGHTVEEIMRALHTRAKKKTQKDLQALVRDENAIVRTIANRRRYFLGPAPYRTGRQRGVRENVIFALRDLSATGTKPEGYTNTEIQEYIRSSTNLGYNQSQVCRATSRSRDDPHIVTGRTHGSYGQRIDLFLWVEKPKTIKPTELIPKPSVPKTEEVDSKPIHDRLRAIADEVRAIVGKGFITRELSLAVREEAFAAVDALETLVDKLS